MAIPIASIGSLPATLEPSAQAASATAPASATATQSGGLFGALLATANAPATDPTETALLNIAPELLTELPADTTGAPDATALSGLLAFAAQILNIPANAAVAQANGEAAAAAPLVQLPADPRARADQLVLDTANGPTVRGAQQPAASAQPAVAPLEPAPVPLPEAEETEPSAAELAERAATSPRTSTPNVVAQPPLLTLGAPVPPAAPALNEVTPPVAEPVAAVPTSALPDATLGARPSTAGEQFAALASSGERLAAPVEAPPELEPERDLAPANFATAVRDALPNATPVTVPVAPAPAAIEAPRAGANVEPVAPAPKANSAAPPVLDEDGILELPPAIPEAPVVTNAPTARIAFPAARSGIPVAAPAVQAQPEPGLAQSALVIASANERLAPRPDFTPTEPPVADAASAPPIPVFAPPVSERAVPAVAPNAPVAPSAPLPAAEQLADALVSKAELAKRNGETEFQMRLDPPELGRLHVKLVASGDELRGQVLVADDSVRRLLESQLPELRHKLEAAGVSVQSLDVATDPNGGGRGAFREERDERPAFAPPVPRETEPPRRLRVPVAPRAGALDVTV